MYEYEFNNLKESKIKYNGIKICHAFLNLKASSMQNSGDACLRPEKNVKWKTLMLLIFKIILFPIFKIVYEVYAILKIIQRIIVIVICFLQFSIVLNNSFFIFLIRKALYY